LCVAAMLLFDLKSYYNKLHNFKQFCSTACRLLVFERRVLRKIYEPTLDNDGTWRIKTNEELEILIKKKIL